MSLRCARPCAPRAAMSPQHPSCGLGLIRWPAVAGAGGVSLFLLLCLAALVWAELRQPSAQAGRRLASDSGVRFRPQAPELPWEAASSDDGPTTEKPPTSFVKSPVSPPLPEPLLSELVMRPGLPPSEQPVMSGEACGTALAFARSPAEAARQAFDERKLLFTLHLSGHFEDPGFT